MITRQNITALFPTPVWDFEIPTEKVDPTAVAKECYCLRKKDPKGRHVSNMGGWQSQLLKLDQLNDCPSILTVIGHINVQAMMALNDFGINLTDVNPIEMIWVNISSKGHFNTRHLHPKSALSGVYYAQADPLTGPIIFHRNEVEDFILTDISNQSSEFSETAVMLDTIPGHFKLFPSWIPHSVGENQSQNDRISFAFNLDKAQSN